MELLYRYMEAKTLFDKYKKLEGELRIELLDELFPAAGTGTSSENLLDYKITGTFGLNTRIDVKALKAIEDELSEDELACLVYKPSLVMKNYNALNEEEREMLDEAIVTSPAMPSVKIKLIEEEL